MPKDDTVLEKTVEKRKEKRAIGLASIQNKPLPPKTSKEDSPRNEIVKLLKRLENKEVQSPKSKVPAVTPVKLQHLRSRSKELDYGAEIALSEDEKVRLDPPEHDKEKILYTVRELILRLAPYDGQGLQRIVDDLNKSGRCVCSSRAFARYFKTYRDLGNLPEVDFYGGTRGRRPFVNTEMIPHEMNMIEHANLSYEGNGDEDSKNAIMRSKKRKASESGACTLSIEEPCRYTIAAMDRFATVYDKDISKRSTKSNARPKSENREIMSRSPRSFMTAAASALATQYISGEFEDTYYSNGRLGVRKLDDNEIPKGTVIGRKIINTFSRWMLGMCSQNL